MTPCFRARAPVLRVLTCAFSVMLTWRMIDGIFVMLSSLTSFFFFQAEDGIRDLIVTGVQTCALPIFDRRQSVFPEIEQCDGLGHRQVRVGVVKDHLARFLDTPVGCECVPTRLAAIRSEERRVGKECRSRWSPYH